MGHRWFTGVCSDAIGRCLDPTHGYTMEILTCIPRFHGKMLAKVHLLMNSHLTENELTTFLAGVASPKASCERSPL